MTLENLLVESTDIKKRRTNKRINIYNYYIQSLSKYVPWIKEQIDKSEEGFIRVKRGDLTLAMKRELAISMGDKYKDKSFNSIFKIIRIVLFNEGIFADLGHYRNERVFIMRYRRPDDRLMSSLKKFEKVLKGENNS